MDDNSVVPRVISVLVFVLLLIAAGATISGCEEWKWGKRADASRVLVDGNR